MEHCPEGRQVNETEGITGWVLAGVASIVGTLSSIVAYLYRQQITDYKEIQLDLESRVEKLTERTDTCERERGELRVKCGVLDERCATLEQRVAHLENRNGEPQ